jgi:alpha-mannosidase
MTLTRDQRINRLRKRLGELPLWTVRAALPLDRWTLNRAPLAPGAPWPSRDGVAAFHHPEVVVPADWPLERTRLELDLGGEGLVQIAYGGGGEGFGLDPNHHSFPLKERHFSVDTEAVARLPFGVPNRHPHLKTARLVLIEPELREFTLLVQLVSDTAEELRGHEAVEPLLDAGERALARVDWPTETRAYVARVAPGKELQQVWELPRDLAIAPPGLDRAELDSVKHATDALRADLRRLRDRYPQTGSLALTGHAHIDLAWLWPLAETRRKAARTFSTMIGLMERYPDFRFNQSTAQLYAYLEEDDPDLLERIKAKVKSGQWEPIGGMWVEPDTNMPTGESFVRQLLYGHGRGSTAAGCSPTPSTIRSAATTPRSARGRLSRPGGTTAASTTIRRA